MPYSRTKKPYSGRKKGKAPKTGWSMKSNWTIARTNTLMAQALAKKYQGVKYFTEMFRASELVYGNVGSGTVGGYGDQFAVRLDDLPNAAGIKALFDKFAVTRMDVLIYPSMSYDNNVSGAGNLSTQFPYITYAINRNGGEGAPSGDGAVLSESNAQRATLAGVDSIVIPIFNPKPWLAEIEGGATGSIGATNSVSVETPGTQTTWLSTNEVAATTNTYWYGARYWVSTPANSGSAAGTPIAEVYYRVYYMCKEQQ